ncbi:hypothetical protein KAN01_09170 [Acinetobacter nosocomialis]|nr:hypothetical protein KAN01_09170 [Acinetobacter nosocomialis]
MVSSVNKFSFFIFLYTVSAIAKYLGIRISPYNYTIIELTYEKSALYGIMINLELRKETKFVLNVNIVLV